MDSTLPGKALYIPHGGGPLPLLGDPGHAEMVEFLQHISADLPRPEAIIVVSAHWEQPSATITSGAYPEIIYDYGGFPEESYHIEYPAPGKPALAEQLAGQLQHAGIDVVLNHRRGFDHGLFVPLKIMYPEADIPCVQVSLLSNLDAGAHIALGQALAPAMEQPILVLGSGFSFHNMRAFFSVRGDMKDPDNEAFEDWLSATCTDPSLSEEARHDRLSNWTRAPHARYCHPRAEHLLPLHVCYGIGGSAARQVFDGRVLGKRASAYLW